jgi:hypothetical protein
MLPGTQVSLCQSAIGYLRLAGHNLRFADTSLNRERVLPETSTADQSQSRSGWSAGLGSGTGADLCLGLHLWGS